MNVKGFGCSFVWGCDLSNYRLAWPALLAQHHGWEYNRYADSGSGNLRIAERVLNELENPEPIWENDSKSCLYIISWTWIDRFDHVQLNNNAWATIQPTDTEKTSKQYYRDLHSQYRDKLTALMCIKTVQDAVLSKGHGLIMTYLDDLLFETDWHTSPAVEFLQRSIQPKMTLFENQTFLEWAKTKGHKISPAWHPLEDAHRAAADLMISYNLV